MVVSKKTLEAQSIEDCGRRGAIRISRILSHAIDAPAGQIRRHPQRPHVRKHGVVIALGLAQKTQCAISL